MPFLSSQLLATHCFFYHCLGRQWRLRNRPWPWWYFSFSIIIVTTAGWWFGTRLLFFHSVGNVIIPSDELIFFRGVGIPPTSTVTCDDYYQVGPSTCGTFGFSPHARRIVSGAGKKLELSVVNGIFHGWFFYRISMDSMNIPWDFHGFISMGHFHFIFLMFFFFNH